MRAVLKSLWRTLTDRSRVDRELSDEVQSYVELLTAEKIAAGATPTEARRAAILELGGKDQVMEEVRDVRAGALIDQRSRAHVTHLFHDLVFSAKLEYRGASRLGWRRTRSDLFRGQQLDV